MLMFRFWSSDPRGSDKTIQVDQSMLDFAKPVQPWISSETNLVTVASPPRPLKRRRQSNVAIALPSVTISPAVKRSRIGESNEDAPPTKLPKGITPSSLTEDGSSSSVSGGPDIDRAREIIEQQFGLEILLKHDELRFINQELAKCQVALEQLRRCHLIPYPTNLPMPEQMINITDGTGSSLQPKTGERMPQWAPPFGVVDGPYARHYAKWLIPDPKFDGINPAVSVQGDGSRLRTPVDGRSTRNSLVDLSASHAKGRPARSNASQKLQALSSGYPLPKNQSGPCVLKRSDGKTVKLVCIDCHRENFSSTQGFINHCRIAHKRDFKSHEEAAVHCGHPIEVSSNPVGVVEEERPAPVPILPSGLVHPFARDNSLAESEACFSVVRRIQDSIDLYHQGRLPGISSIPSAPKDAGKAQTNTVQHPSFSPSTGSPHLSRLLQSRGFSGNLGSLVREAKTKVDWDEILSPEGEGEEIEDHDAQNASNTTNSGQPRMRVPARAAMSPITASHRPTSSKGPAPLIPYATPIPTPKPRATSSAETGPVMDEDLLDAELSPNTAISNNAPSLVSDDGEFDDSAADSESESEMSVSLGTHSISDVEEIDIDGEHHGARSLSRHRGSAGATNATTVRLGKDDSKHVTFVGPVKSGDNGTQACCHGPR